MLARFIDKQAEFLLTEQQKDGSFLSFSSPDPTNYHHALSFASTFSTALVLSSLCFRNESKILSGIKKNAHDFLLTQRSEMGSFNYWKRNSKEMQTMPYPDDLDDSACALSSLYLNNPNHIDGAVLGQFVSLLTELEIREGGPYRTWLVPKKAKQVWKDVDLAVNSNIAYFLSLQSIELPNLTEYVEKHIVTGDISSPYYPSPYPILYFISRFYKGKYLSTLQQLILEKMNTNNFWENPLYTALNTTSLLQMGTDPKIVAKSISYLTSLDESSLHRPYPFYTGVNPKRDQTFYAGSAALTTSFCIEAVAQYTNAIENQRTQQLVKSGEENTLYQEVVHTVLHRFDTFDEAIRKNVRQKLTAILSGNFEKQVALLPYYFSTAIGKKTKNIPDAYIKQLCTGTLFGWLAYTIYDDFYDREGDPPLLSVANIALREVALTFTKSASKEFRSTFQHIMDDLEAANAWEAAQCWMTKDTHIPHFGDYSILAKKSFAHTLGPLALLYKLGYSSTSKEIVQLTRFFRHYLIARQLNDDAHDWEQDLLQGHINPVNAQLLLSYPNGRHRLSHHMTKLRKIFWDDVIIVVCEDILDNVGHAEESLNQLTFLEHPEFLESLLEPLRTSVETVFIERKRITQFLKVFT